MDEIIRGSFEEENTPELEQSVVMDKLRKRVDRGKPADLICLDLDGTVYNLEEMPDGKWQKKGDNTDLSKLMESESIPHIVISGRPEWYEKSDEEMAGLGLSKPDAVVAGAGSIIYWRDTEGRMKCDQEFAEKMRQQKISYIENGESIETTYQPERLSIVLTDLLEDYKDKGFVRAKVDRHSQGGFVTLDMTEITFENLREIVQRINKEIGGLRVSFSEDLEHVSPDAFTGWVQVLPHGGGKDGATRFILDKIAKNLNPAQTDEKRLRAHIFGDAAVDIWMLSLGTGKGHAYETHQFLLDNATPYAKKKLRILADACSGEVSAADKDRISQLGQKGLLQDHRRKLISELNDLDQADPKNDQRIKGIRSELHRITQFLHPEYPSAHLKLVEQPGPEGILAEARKL